MGGRDEDGLNWRLNPLALNIVMSWQIVFMNVAEMAVAS